MKTSPTQRSLKLLRDAGYHACVLEHWNAFARRRIDAFNFGDILAVRASENGSYLVQTTAAPHLGERVTKILDIQAARVWLAAGNRILVHEWAKRGPRGARKTWQCRVKEMTLADFSILDELDDKVRV